MINRLSKISILVFVCVIHSMSAATHINLFQPYDILLRPPMPRGACWYWGVGYEGAFDACSFQAEDEQEECGNDFRKCGKILQLFQDKQDAIAALKGTDFDTAKGELATLLNRHDATGEHAWLIPEACFDVHNILLSTWYFISPTTDFELHLPVRVMELSRVRWREHNSGVIFDDLRIDNVIAELERVGNINLGSWRRSGVGDLTLFLSWQRNFPQGKPLLRNVYTRIRGGFIFPTGEEADEDRLLALPFGHGAGLGILANGFIEARLLDQLLLGIDVEFTHLIGDTRMHRIKTDPAQTDLLLLNKVCAYKEPGFKQHYTLYAQLVNIISGISARLSYQFTRQEDSRLFLATDHFDPCIANTAERLQEWTTHDLVADITYHPRHRRWPSLSFLIKHGFNGQRAILIDSAAVRVSFSF